MGLKIPKSWSDISINQFLNIQSALEMRDVSKLDRNILLCAAILKTDSEWVEDNMTLEQVYKVIQQTTFAHDLPKARVRKYFWCGGKLFKVELHAKNILPSQFIDISTMTKNSQETLDNTAKIMATICRPVFSKYDSSKVDEYSKLFGEKLRFDIAYSTALFFWELYNEFLNATLTYLKEQRKALKAEKR